MKKTKNARLAHPASSATPYSTLPLASRAAWAWLKTMTKSWAQWWQ